MSKSKEQIMDTRNADNIQHSNSLNIMKSPLSLRQQLQMGNATIIAIKEGELNPIKAELALKSMENVIKYIRSNAEVKDITRTETEKYGKSFEMFGAKIENSTRTVYDYSICKDEVYNEMIKQREQLELQIKAREAMLKTGVNPDSGECFTKPTTKVTEFLKITFKED